MSGPQAPTKQTFIAKRLQLGLELQAGRQATNADNERLERCGTHEPPTWREEEVASNHGQKESSTPVKAPLLVEVGVQGAAHTRVVRHGTAWAECIS